MAICHLLATDWCGGEGWPFAPLRAELRHDALQARIPIEAGKQESHTQ